jgi:predicted RNA-binding protein associated with RNAse of E/G family
MVAAGADGVRLRLPPDAWALTKVKTPADRRFLAVHATGAEHSLLAIWDDNWQMVCWYVNLESDLARTHNGVEYEDRFLDIVAEPDLSSWRWKDEDELEEAMGRGLVTTAQADAFRAEGERAIEWLLARRPPYDRPWDEWRPPEEWRLPR